MNLDDARTKMNSRKAKYRKERRKRRKNQFFLLVIGIISLASIFLVISNSKSLVQKYKDVQNELLSTEKHAMKEETIFTTKIIPTFETPITISVAGDFTLGADEELSYMHSFTQVATDQGLAYFTKGLDRVFEQDDLSTVNLETALTTASEKVDKQFRFKGNPSYAKILALSGIEAVNVANNHTYDYLEAGYEDTLSALDQEKISYFGNGHIYVTTVKDIQIGVLGYKGWSDSKEVRDTIEHDIQSLRNEGVHIIIVHFHWGREGQYVPIGSQVSLGHYTIDQGADLVVGHHPHVIQGMEEYKGKFIVYSLGNFMYGGHRNPKDKDTLVFRQTFYVENGLVTDKKEIAIIPFSISSTDHRNDFQPTKLLGKEKERVIEKIIDLSKQIVEPSWLPYLKTE